MPSATATKSPTSDTMIHHKGPIYYMISGRRVPGPYGVSQIEKAITPSLLNKKHDQIREYLISLGFTTAEREVIFRLLRFSAYYGRVYPKESLITSNPGCSKATFWRTIRKLKQKGLIEVVNRYLRRPKAQIANLYLLAKLALAICRLLAEKGTRFHQNPLTRFLNIDGSHFWTAFWGWHTRQIDLRG